jgi:glutaconyl-CoA/methylmalonyl-CoA decarboxylase subunit gamma
VKKFKVKVEGKEYLVEVEELSGAGTAYTPQVAVPVADKLSASPGPAATTAIPAAKNPVPVKDSPSPAPAADGGELVVKAPMPGSILEVKVKAGDQTGAGDVLIVLEAMKMENELTAPQAGTVKEVLVKKGDTVNSGDPLIVLS